MCGRYGFVPGEDFYSRFEVKNNLPKLPSYYNVAPGFQMPVIIRESPNQVALMKWGLIPFWAKDPKIGYQMINARAESLQDKPSFRKPLLSQRCLVPASFFYEWKETEEGKIPYYIHIKDTSLFAFAGLYDSWIDAEGKEIKSYTIITTTSNALIISIHDRMPVILDKRYEDTWINEKEKDINKLLSLLTPYEGKDMDAYPVSRAVNKTSNDGPDLIKPHKEETPQIKLY